jgi:hypothetical protein
MIESKKLEGRIKQNYNFFDALTIINDTRTFKLNLDLSMLLEDFEYPNFDIKSSRAVYDWLHDNVCDIHYISNAALTKYGLHNFAKPIDSPNFRFVTYLLIPDDTERILFKLKFSDLIVI